MTDEPSLDHEYPIELFDEHVDMFAFDALETVDMLASPRGQAYSALASRFVRAAAYGAGRNGRVDRIVIHTMEAPLKVGTALAVARYFASGAGGRNVSAHYCVDPGTIIACLHDADRGYHAPPNAGSIGIEQAGYTASNDWHAGAGNELLRHSAALAADLCRRHVVPMRWLNPTDLRHGLRGITGHLEVGQAFRQTSHTDPGARFPRDLFMSLVRDGATPPPPPPDKVPPMFNPPHNLEPIADAQPAPEGGVLLLAVSGAIYAYGGARFPGSCNGQPWFAGRRGARLEYVGTDPSAPRRWRVTAHTGEQYHLPLN